jgi:hypothetical protein
MVAWSVRGGREEEGSIVFPVPPSFPPSLTTLDYPMVGSPVGLADIVSGCASPKIWKKKEEGRKEGSKKGGGEEGRRKRGWKEGLKYCKSALLKCLHRCVCCVVMVAVGVVLYWCLYW